MVFLRYFGAIFKYFLYVTTFKITVDKESVGFHDVCFLFFKVFPILLIALDMLECIRIQSLLREHAICIVCSAFALNVRHKTTSNNCLNVIAHLNDIRRTIRLVNKINLFTQGFCTILTITNLQNSHVSRNSLGVKKATKSCNFVSTDRADRVLDRPVLASFLPVFYLAACVNIRVILSIRIFPILLSLLILRLFFAIFSKALISEGIRLRVVSTAIAIVYYRQSIKIATLIQSRRQCLRD